MDASMHLMPNRYAQRDMELSSRYVADSEYAEEAYFEFKVAEVEGVEGERGTVKRKKGTICHFINEEQAIRMRDHLNSMLEEARLARAEAGVGGDIESGDAGQTVQQEVG